MEKMGWEKGKGLGAKEDGNTEHVKVSVKQDNRGKCIMFTIIVMLNVIVYFFVCTK